MDWRRGLRGVGRTLIGAGVLVLLFVVYQLWGTGLAEKQSQKDLRKQFEAAIGGKPQSTSDVPVVQADGVATTVPATAATAPPSGDAVAVINIDKIGVHKAVVEGVAVSDLKKGPGHYPGTPLPGQTGNAAIAGHRTTYGAPFYRLDELHVGDPITVVTRQGTYLYEVDKTLVVKPNDVSVVDPTPDARLTLTTCNPRFSAAQRLVVQAVLKGTPAAAPTTTVPPAGAGSGPDATVTTVPPDQLANDAAADLSGDTGAWLPTILYALAALAAGLGIWLVSRRWRRWPAYLLGAPVVLVILFFLFENVNRLLPSNV